MDWQGPGFVLVIIALCYGGWLINNWIRARHGYALEDEWGGKSERADTAAVDRLNATVNDLEKRLAQVEQRAEVLERIVTDRGPAIAAEIEALRSPGARQEQKVI